MRLLLFIAPGSASDYDSIYERNECVSERRYSSLLRENPFGDSIINNYDPTTGAFLGTISRADGTPLQFDGLWDMLPLGSGVYLTAGIGDEAHGLFGLITED